MVWRRGKLRTGTDYTNELSFKIIPGEKDHQSITRAPCVAGRNTKMAAWGTWSSPVVFGELG